MNTQIDFQYYPSNNQQENLMSHTNSHSYHHQNTLDFSNYNPQQAQITPQQQQQSYFNPAQYNTFYTSTPQSNHFLNEYTFNSSNSQTQAQIAQLQTPPPSNTNTPQPNVSYLKGAKAYKTLSHTNSSSLLNTKKEIEHFEDFTDSSCKTNEDEEEEEFSDEEEDEDDEEDEEEEFYGQNKKRKLQKQNEIDHENDYEIKHNCLTEEGAYLNTLFNSPSSLSSSSLNQSTKTLTKTNTKNKNNKSKMQCKDNNSTQAEQTQQLITVTKVECADDLTETPEQTVLNDISKSAYYHNQQSQPANQHMSNMINSYNLAGIMNDYDLVNLPLRELNKRLRFLPKQMAYNMKKRRRTLKNRKYAQNCRSKRLEQKSEMEIQNSQLKMEITRLNRMLEKIQNENNLMRSYLNQKNAADADEANKALPLTPTTPNNQLSHLLSLPPIHHQK